MSYSFSYEAAAVPNLPYNVTNEKLILPEAWIPLRPLESYEKLAFRSQLPPEAGVLVVFSSNDVFLLLQSVHWFQLDADIRWFSAQ
jgi:hypothetical protein